ncbi:MAG TPA: sigma-70 family RNA polymerase sigma factor [Phycisphaerae bacterium]|nr:sigma-70 family RNA polymerase sigma factor [Phycisphaerae bacterium]
MLRVTTKLSERKSLRDWMAPPPFVTNVELRRRGLEKSLFANWPGAAAGSGRLRYEDETLLFKQLHFSAYKMSRLYTLASKVGVTPRIKREYSLWTQRYTQIRTRLTEGNLGLVYDLMGRSRFDNLEREEMSSEGMMALLRAVDTFDPWRGFRFSTYACNAILRAFSRAAMMDSKRRSKIAGPWDPEFEQSDMPELRKDHQRALFEERLQRILRMDNAMLSDVEKTVLARRFPMESDRERQTLEDIGKQMRVSKERVRQIQLSAISKLREALSSDLILQD